MKLKDIYTSNRGEKGRAPVISFKVFPPKNSNTSVWGKEINILKNYASGVFCYANQLVEFIKSRSDVSIGVAGYPEGHIECPLGKTDIENIKKIGIGFAIDQCKDLIKNCVIGLHFIV